MDFIKREDKLIPVKVWKATRWSETYWVLLDNGEYSCYYENHWGAISKGGSFSIFHTDIIEDIKFSPIWELKKEKEIKDYKNISRWKNLGI
jgi:hypothetical protein